MQCVWVAWVNTYISSIKIMYVCACGCVCACVCVCVCVYVSMDQRDCLSLGEGTLGKMPFQRLQGIQSSWKDLTERVLLQQEYTSSWNVGHLMAFIKSLSQRGSTWQLLLQIFFRAHPSSHKDIGTQHYWQICTVRVQVSLRPLSVGLTPNQYYSVEI